MGTYLKQYEKENMRTAMLKQEETFKHQVHELHRLYRVQKVLVDDVKAEIKRRRKSYSDSGTELERWNTDNERTSQQPCYSTSQDQRRPRRALNLDLAAEEYTRKDNRDVDEDGSDLDLTLAIGSKSRRKKENSSSTSDSGATSFSSSSSDCGAKMKLNGNEWGVFQIPDINLGNYPKERKSVSNVDEHMREERVNQPPWLFHRLSLNMT